MDNTSVLILQGISQLDLFELEHLSDPGLVEIRDPTVDTNEHGELLTAAALVWLSAQGLRVLASWLNKRRSAETLTVSGTLRNSDGSEREITINWSGKEAEAPMPEQLQALAKLLDVKPPALPA